MISMCILEGNIYIFSAKYNIGTVENVHERERTYIHVPIKMAYNQFHDVAMDSCKIAHKEFKEFVSLTDQFYNNARVQRTYPIFFSRS